MFTRKNNYQLVNGTNLVRNSFFVIALPCESLYSDLMRPALKLIIFLYILQKTKIRFLQLQSKTIAVVQTFHKKFAVYINN